ncbi:unspecified product [Leishmania tarentolae]|uniref:Unspecified product n=1 Tax=Leishmania tarentolae TaxID=5689 RepID=A0A640KD65_LEITA|nr:unspecified product [Leishmania tarentolae]
MCSSHLPPFAPFHPSPSFCSAVASRNRKSAAHRTTFKRDALHDVPLARALTCDNSRMHLCSHLSLSLSRHWLLFCSSRPPTTCAREAVQYTHSVPRAPKPTLGCCTRFSLSICTSAHTHTHTHTRADLFCFSESLCTFLVCHNTCSAHMAHGCALEQSYVVRGAATDQLYCASLILSSFTGVQQRVLFSLHRNSHERCRRWCNGASNDFSARSTEDCASADPPPLTQLSEYYRKVACVPPSDESLRLADCRGQKGPRNLHFVLDRAFDRDVTQEDVYEAAVLDCVDGILTDTNASIFSHGHIAIGKTFTVRRKMTVIQDSGKSALHAVAADRGVLLRFI